MLLSLQLTQSRKISFYYQPSFSQLHENPAFGCSSIWGFLLVSVTCSENGNLQLERAAQSPVRSVLECFQGWGIHHVSLQLVPVLHHPHYGIFFPFILSECALFQCKTITLVLSQRTPIKSLSSFFLQASFKYWKTTVSSPQFSLLWSEQPQFSQPLFRREVLHACDNFCGLSLDSIQQLHILLCWAAQIWLQCSRWQGQSRGEKLPPSPCWPHLLWHSPGLNWLSGLWVCITK